MSKPALTIIKPDFATELKRPVFLSRVPAGFPSPADDYIEGTLDLNQHLVKHKAATFFVRVSGSSMEGAGIYDGDRGQVAGAKNQKRCGGSGQR